VEWLVVGASEKLDVSRIWTTLTAVVNRHECPVKTLDYHTAAGSITTQRLNTSCEQCY
jgi:hypothetical protein